MANTKLKIIEPKTPKFKDEAEALIAQAIDRNVPVETMEKLLAMRRELKAEKAKEEFDRSMAAFQADCPTIEKTKKVLDRDKVTVRYKYAPLESIIEQVKGLLAKHGFSYTMDTIQDEKMLGVICKATHKAGHAQETTFSVPLGTEQYMSDVQKYGARLTFAKRYAFCNAFGILTGDEDTDAPAEAKPAPATPHVPGITTMQEKKIFALLEEKGKVKDDLDAYIEKRFNKDSLTKLTVSEASETIEKLTSLPTPVIEVDINDIPDNLGEEGGDK